MFACRNAWQRLVPLTQRASASLLRNAPVRQMSASSVPGSSGEALPYYLLVGVTMLGGVVYAYRTVCNDRARSRERHEYVETQLKPQLQNIKEQETTEPVVEAVAAETSPVLEASSDNIPVELASAAEDWSEFSARKPEESVEENVSVAEESEGAVESEAAASS